jgi:crotonobetainyl-CoA:carnitine CoA-transferase CaiB-like acyl-CoA transferase
MMDGTGPLDGVRVLELGHYIAAPFCTQILADQGADVIKVEPPGGGARRNSDPKANPGGYFNMLNRNKRSIGVDLKSDQGQRTLRALVGTADVLVTNFAVGVPDRLGFGYPALREVNPRLVYVHASGFGTDSPYATKPAFDGIIQAMSGLMHLTGEPAGAPSLAGLFIPDHVTGMYAALAAMFGLRRRDVSGEGSFTDLSMLDSMMSFLGASLSEVIDLGISPKRTGGSVRRSYASTYAAEDGYVYLAPLSARMWEGVAQVVGAPELLEFYSTEPGSVDRRMADRPRLDDVIGAWTRTRTIDAVIEAMTAVGVPCSPIFDIERLAADPHVAQHRMVRELPLHGGLTTHVAASPLPAVESTYTASPPAAGQHTDEILAELGLTDLAETAVGGTS